MIAKVFVLLAVVAAAHATALIGAPLLAGGHLGVVSAQRSAINHIAPVAPLGVAAAPLGIAAAAPLGIAAPLAVGHGLAAAPLAYGVGAAGLGYGIGAADLGYGVGAAGLGYGIGAAGLGYGIRAPLAVGHGLIGGNLRADGIVGSGILGSRYGTAIGHTAAVGHAGLLGAGLHGARLLH